MSEIQSVAERCADMLEQAVSTGYPSPLRKVDQCEHGKYGWEDCIACYDEFLLSVAEQMRALAKADAIEALSPLGEGEVERAAKAMCDEINFSFDGFNDQTKDKYRRMARAALTSARAQC